MNDGFLGFEGARIAAIPDGANLFTAVLGFPPAGFHSSDYFPLLPYLGWFLLGSILGRRLYPRKQSRFPGTDPDKPLLRFLRFCGTHSLVIYLIHQPLIFLIHSILMLL